MLLHAKAAGIVIAFTLIMMQECIPQEGKQPSSEVMSIPTNDRSGRSLIANLMRPAGSGPFPLAIINHGSPALASRRPGMAIPTFDRISKFLIERGFAVVLPLRRGYGAVGGRWNEGYGSCEHPDFKQAGLETARDIRAVIDALVRRDFVQKQNVFVIGQSAGGWGTLALASQNPKDVKGYVIFAGGRGGHRNNMPNQNCAPDELVRVASDFGKTSHGASLWIYSENDSFFSPVLARRMFDSYRSAGGKATLHVLPPVGEDGHQAISNQQAFQLWAPFVGKFLDHIQ
jgi:dienelactone hydrolase